MAKEFFYIERLVKLRRPTAKFVSISHSSDFTEPIPLFKEGYYYVNLYDEKIDSVFNRTPKGLYIVDNTYLSSFAYNLFLSALYSFNSSEKAFNEDAQAIELLTHNFKKFFGEQLLHFNEKGIFSRAVLLETLLYEQHQMIPVFKAKETNPKLNTDAQLAASLMSSLVSFHEFGHYVLDNNEDTWSELLREYPDTLGLLYNNIKDSYPEIFITEFKCDVISVINCLLQFKSNADAASLLKIIIFGFSSFAVMWSLVKSAEATAHEHKEIKEEVDLKSIEPNHREFDFKLGRDIDFIERATLMIELCKRMATKEKIELFGKEEGFNLPETILEDLLSLLDKIMIMEDENARRMALLVAESLHGHEEGMEYLYLRSKVFTSNRKELRL